MPERVNDPKKLEDWMVKVEQRLRELEARRLDAGTGTEVDHATKTVSAKISDDPGNSTTIGEDGGIKSTDTITTADDHSPLYMQKFTTGSQSINNATDTLLSWGGTDASGTWTSDGTSITIPQDGHYHVTVTYPWANNATGIRAIHVLLNSTVVTTGSIFAGTIPVESNNESLCLISDYRNFVTGDVLRVYGFQSSGIALNGGTPYFGDVRGRWAVVKVHDAYPPALSQTTA